MRQVDANEYLDMVCGLLAEGADCVSIPVSGDSMRPFLRPGDTAFLVLPERTVRKGDVLLYCRPNGQYILHRVVKIGKDGTLWMMGDAQRSPEPMRPGYRIRARVTYILRGGKKIRKNSLFWWFFAHPWRALYPVRGKLIRLWRFLKNTKKS